MTPEQLKASILQMAIQGKLVEQRSEEGTAEELYQKIQKERKKYTIKDIEIGDSFEKAFDIPETWKWIHLQDVVRKTIKRGKSPKYTEKSKIQVFAQKCNVKSGGINMELALFLDESVIDKYPDDEFMQDGDIVINSTGGGTMGRVGVFFDTDRINKMRIVPDGHVTVIRACKEIDNRFLYYFIKNNQKYLETQGDGSTNQTELKPFTIASLELPLPPLKEQLRIVAKIEELLPYVDRYAEAYEKLEKFNAKFPEDMKKSILQYAIQGKLVEQRPEEGTGEELYQRIQKEKQKLIKEGKIKKEKPLEEIKEDEIPFDIPESWKWVRVGSIFTLQAGKNISSSDIHDKKSKESPYLCYGGNGIRGYVSNPNRNGYYAIIGRQGALCGCINFAKGEFYATEHAVVVDHYGLMDPEWSGMFLKALNLNQYATATAQPGLAVANINQVLIPLPPLKEQKRIVKKINEVLPFCDRLIRGE